MPKIAEKGHKMPASPIRKLVPFADKAKAKGLQVFHLNIGQPDIETPQIVLDAIKNIDFKVWAYTHSEGTPEYRKKLAGYYQKIGYNGVTEKNIIVTTGGSEAITIAIQSCINPGEEIIIPEPYYANYNGFSCMADIVVKPISSSIESGFALPPIAEFEKIITPKTKGIMICNPNNPTGYVYSKAELEALAVLVKKHDLFLFSDEAYREFCYGDEGFLSPIQLPGMENHVIVLDTISKRYSACGARLGCLLTHNQEVLSAALRFAQARLCPPALAQIAATAAVDTPDSYFAEVKAEYLERRDTLVKGLNSIEGVFCPEPKGAFYAIAKLPVKDADHFCEWILDQFEHKGKTVMMAPASGFYSNPALGKNQVRLAYVLNSKEITEAIECIAEALKVYPN
jgi:aspartate aminotransferase